jgi:hypothetical protein
VGLWVTVAVIAVLLAAYAGWTARRLDRLHARLDAAAAGLEAQLKARAMAATELAASGELPRSLAAEVAHAASAAAAAAGLDHAREAVESSLSRTLQDASAGLDPDTAVSATLADAVTRTTFARRFHNDAVRDAHAVRRRRIVRLMHLAGHAPQPTYFEMDDARLSIADVAATAAPYD